MTHGAMFVPIILGSDKTTVSVGTGNNEYWPLYGSIGNIHNNVRRAHGSGLVLIGFLSIPKSMYFPKYIFQSLTIFLLASNAHSQCPDFRQFRRKLYHTSLSTIMDSLRPGETNPEIYRCPDGHFRHILWGLGPYIADYQEQILLACVVQHWCCR